MKNHILSVDVDWILNINQYSSLIKYVCSKLEFCKQIIFIDNHHNILDFLNKEDVSIINIDQHADITNPSNNFSDYVNEGNWINYLICENRLLDYIWVNNLKSYIDESEINRGGVRNLRTFKIKSNLDFIKDLNYEKIIICESRDFAGEMNRENLNILAFDTLNSISTSLFNEKTIIDKQLNPYKYKIKL
jgi:hypothetical protein